MSLPLYTGPVGQCIKCTDTDARTTYHPCTTAYRPERIGILDAPSHGEFLARECRTCSFRWAEAVVVPASCNRCKGSGIDPEDSFPADGPSDYSMGEPPVLEPCRDCQI